MNRQLTFTITISLFFLAALCLFSWTTASACDVSQKNDTTFELMNSESFGSLKMSMASGEVVKLLGKPEKQSKAMLQPADGAWHQTWVYMKKGIIIEMSSDSQSGAQQVCSVTLKSPCSLKTKKGIALGASYQEVMKAYTGNIDKEQASKNAIIAGSVFGGVVFTFTGGKVTRIYLGASAE
jgi:hypothetical protein